MKSHTIKISILLVMCLFSSCQNDYYNLTNVYVENPTNTEYLIFLDYKSFINSESNKLCVILPNTSKQIIDTYITDNDVDNKYLGDYPFYAWIYNRKDSTYVKLDSRDFMLMAPCPYAKVETSHTKQRISTLITNEYIIINDSLISKMTKNTHLTDSIFGLKK
jgi:hypothetical protein